MVGNISSSYSNITNALENIDLGQNSKNMVDKSVKQITGLAEAKTDVSFIKAQDKNLGTVLDMKA